MSNPNIIDISHPNLHLVTGPPVQSTIPILPSPSDVWNIVISPRVTSISSVPHSDPSKVTFYIYVGVLVRIDRPPSCLTGEVQAYKIQLIPDPISRYQQLFIQTSPLTTQIAETYTSSSSQSISGSIGFFGSEATGNLSSGFTVTHSESYTLPGVYIENDTTNGGASFKFQFNDSKSQAANSEAELYAQAWYCYNGDNPIYTKYMMAKTTPEWPALNLEQKLARLSVDIPDFKLKVVVGNHVTYASVQNAEAIIVDQDADNQGTYFSIPTPNISLRTIRNLISQESTSEGAVVAIVSIVFDDSNSVSILPVLGCITSSVPPIFQVRYGVDKMTINLEVDIGTAYKPNPSTTPYSDAVTELSPVINSALTSNNVTKAKVNWSLPPSAGAIE
jgi:hypothetical protein